MIFDPRKVTIFSCNPDNMIPVIVLNSVLDLHHAVAKSFELCQERGKGD